MINLEVLLDELIKRKDHSNSVEIKTLEGGQVFSISLVDTEHLSLSEIAHFAFKGIQFEDSNNEELHIYKSGDIWKAAKCRIISNTLMEYWVEKELNTAEEFYDYIFEECKKSERYHKDDWVSKIGLPDLYDLYEEKLNQLKVDGWKLVYKYQDSDLIDGDLYREIYYRNTENYTVEVINIHPPEGNVSLKNRIFFSDHTRWDIDSSYSWADFYETYQQRKGLDEIFEVETLNKSDFLQELLEKEEFYGKEILIG